LTVQIFIDFDQPVRRSLGGGRRQNKTVLLQGKSNRTLINAEKADLTKGARF
jgi:hypothetical protein